MFPLATRHARRRLVLEFNPHQVLAAEISRPQRGKVVVEATAEFARQDAAGLSQWLETRPWTRVICGMVPRRGIVQRESLQPKRLSEPTYLADTIEEQQKGQFLSATPFKIVKPEDWTLRAVDAADGKRLGGDGPPQAAVVCGMANDEVQDVQQRLLDERLIPERIESSLLSLFGAVLRHTAKRSDHRAVAIVVVHQLASTIYILGKEGVHTPTPILHGLGSVEDLAKKEFGIKTDAEVERMLHAGNPQVLQRADRLVRRIGRDLKPVLDSYEMTTGQPLDEIFCAYLPPTLAWLGDALATVTGRVPTTIFCSEWMPTVGLQIAEGSPVLGTHWIGALSLVANLPETARGKFDRGNEDVMFPRPWHVDYKLPAITAERVAASRRFLTGAVAVALTIFTVALTSWQLYANSSLRDDRDYWERQMTVNRTLFEELSAANTKLQTQSVALKQAYELMAAPYPLSDFIISLGRTIPPHMRIDRIETNERRTAVSGVLLEPAEEATGTLGAYIEGLRRNAAIGPFFSSITITSLQRKGDGDAVLFEITLRLKDPPS
jgi:hypothetical protein